MIGKYTGKYTGGGGAAAFVNILDNDFFVLLQVNKALQIKGGWWFWWLGVRMGGHP